MVRPSSPYFAVPASTPRPEFWLPDDSISTEVIADGRLYIGGRFAHVGPFTGPFAVADATTGIPESYFPHSNGFVNVVISDGQGGWFLGGEFTEIGGASRTNLAWVLADGSLASFAPVVGSDVYSLTLVQSTLYVGGSFQNAGGATRNKAAAFDVTSGALLPWAPIQSTLDHTNRITRILVDGTVAYLAGYYDTSGAFPRRHIAAVDATSGQLISGFNPNPDGAVYDLTLRGSQLYAGGNFTQIGGAARNRVAVLDKQSGAVGSLNPNINGTVMALAMDASTLYVGGAFTTAAGQTRGCGAAFDTTSGSILPWDPLAAAPDMTSLEIDDIAVGLGAVYVCGSFQSIGTQRTFAVGRLDPASGLSLAWVGDAAGPDATIAHSIALDGTHLACGGNFTIMGGEHREGAAALDLGTGQLTPWHPQIYGQSGPPQIGQVLRILPVGSTVWVGGQFSYVNGVQRNALVSVDAISGATNLAFNPGLFLTGDFVEALAMHGPALFAGGSFQLPSGQHDLIAFDPVSGAVVPGSTDVAGTIYDLVFSSDGTRLYIAGQLFGAGVPLLPRNNLASIDPSTGAVLPWDPSPNQVVQSLIYEGDRVWAAGPFNQIGGQLLRGVASIDPITGAVDTAFAPDLRRSGVAVGASAVAWLEGTLIAGGGFDTVNSQSQNYVAAFNPANGALLNWNPYILDGVSHLAIGGKCLGAVGVKFGFPAGDLRPTLAVYSVP